MFDGLEELFIVSNFSIVARLGFLSSTNGSLVNCLEGIPIVKGPFGGWVLSWDSDSSVLGEVIGNLSLSFESSKFS